MTAVPTFDLETRRKNVSIGTLAVGGCRRFRGGDGSHQGGLLPLFAGDG
jgi:hypothetical protein